MCSCRTYVRWWPASSFRASSCGRRCAPGRALRCARRARARRGRGAAARPGDRRGRGEGSQAGHAHGGGARHLSRARPRRAGSVRGRAGLGGDPAAARGLGFEVDAGDLGCVFFETRGVERLYGGVEAALERALAAVGSAWDPRAGAAGRRFAALAAANVARPGQVLIVADERTRDFLAPLPLALLPLAEQRRRELEELGVRNVGELAGLRVAP